jgi:hypothetical protein
MSIEDRLRAATRARTALVRDIRPLELPDKLPARARRARRWLTWGAPIGAAALVTALALVLVMLRQADGPRPGPAAPTTSSSIPASIPRYYVALAYPSGTPVSKLSTARLQAVIGDGRTGPTLAVVPPPSGQSFSGVTAAADDRTFVVSSYWAAQRETTWYLLRITPGAAHPAQLTKLPIKPLPAQPTGLALSPDGSELAIMFATSSLQLQTYSVSSGAPLGTWHTDTAHWMLRTQGANAYGLSWSADDRHIAFRFDAYAGNSSDHLVTVRTLDVTAAGHDLIADSRLVLQVPLAVTKPVPAQPCATSLATPDDSSVICGTYVLPDAQNQASCPNSTSPSLVRYSAATGKPQVLARYPSVNCQSVLAVPLWTDSSGRHVIGFVVIQMTAQKGKGKVDYGSSDISSGPPTPLPVLIVDAVALSPGGIAL